MSTTPTTTVGGGEHHRHRGRRLRNFLLPDGREIHVAPSPEEAETIRQRLAAVRKQDEPFDLVVNGSPEHIDALRKAHSHHETRREALREKHGEAFDEFENVKSELDALGSELHMLTDHAVSLDANFSKYGYSAHLRTYGEGQNSSSASSISGSHNPDHEKKDWESERTNATGMRIYRKPTVRQYFHKGLLWRASETTEVASFELFVDLLYVGILAINGDHAADEPTGYELLKFSITFIMSWKIWSDLTIIVSWFEIDDIIQRICVVFTMACLLGLTTNMIDAFNDTYTQLVAFYVAARLFMCAYFVLLIFLIPMIRGMMIGQVIVGVIPNALWISSTHVEMPQRLGVIWVAIFLDLYGPSFIVLLFQYAKYVSKPLSEWVDKVFEFFPAINIEHKVERTNAFVTLVFGYSVVAIIYQSASPFGLNPFYGKAVLGLIQAFCFNWIYFELDGADIFTHAIRRKAVSATIWGSVHLPFVMAFVLGAAALSKLVVATDLQDEHLEDLTETYIEKSDREIPVGLRWFYCAGLGLALFCMGIISICHIHKDSPRGIRIRKRHRMINRFAICIVLFCLPTAKSLNSLQLISIVTGLIVWVLLLELWGASCPEDSLFGDKKTCRYTAQCKISKKDLEAAAKDGHTIKVGDLGDAEESRAYEFS